MISKLAMTAKKTIEAAWLNGPSYDLATQAAEALESAQQLQSPETAAELQRLRDRVAELEAMLPADPGAVADLLTIAPAWHADATYNPTFKTIELDLTATTEQWRAWQVALHVDLARTTHRGNCITSHATWRRTHVVIRCWPAPVPQTEVSG